MRGSPFVIELGRTCGSVPTGPELAGSVVPTAERALLEEYGFAAGRFAGTLRSHATAELVRAGSDARDHFHGRRRRRFGVLLRRILRPCSRLAWPARAAGGRPARGVGAAAPSFSGRRLRRPIARGASCLETARRAACRFPVPDRSALQGPPAARQEVCDGPQPQRRGSVWATRQSRQALRTAAPQAQTAVGVEFGTLQPDETAGHASRRGHPRLGAR